MCLIALPMTALSTRDNVGDTISGVNNVPVKEQSVTLLEDQEAANARTGRTAMYKPLMLKDSKNISAVRSLFSGSVEWWFSQ